MPGAAARHRRWACTIACAPSGEATAPPPSPAYKPRSAARLEAHLLLHRLVDPDSRVDRARPDGARAQLAIVVLHPGPPGREDIGGWQPDVRRLVEHLDGHLAEHLLPL